MSSLKADFNELMERIKQGREFGHASFEPIFYLVFPPNQILNVKRETPAWMHRLRNEGWEVETFSIAEHVANIIEKAPLRKIWLAADQKARDAALQASLKATADRLAKEKADRDAALAASIFHFKEIGIPDLKKYLKENNIEVRV